MSSPPIPLHRTFFSIARDWTEALVIAFIVAMFVRTFVVELFRIPSGSMSPTLIGDIAANVDIDNNGELDQIVYHPEGQGGGLAYQVFYQDNGEYVGVDLFSRSGARYGGRGSGRRASLSQSQRKLIKSQLEPRYDRILVNKMTYWFDPKPQRADIMVFKVPPASFTIERPFFIKRVAGLENEDVSVSRDGDLIVDGERIVEPEIHDRIFYNHGGDFLLRHGGHINVPPGHFLAFGDNSFSSSDSRYWGPVPHENLKGKAFLRYWPRSLFGYLK